jgi:hypothetical protein
MGPIALSIEVLFDFFSIFGGYFQFILVYLEFLFYSNPQFREKSVPGAPTQSCSPWQTNSLGGSEHTCNPNYYF